MLTLGVDREISKGENTNNLVLYPPTEPSPSIKLGYTLAQKLPHSDEPELGNEDIKPILTIGEALCFKDDMEAYNIRKFISSPNFVFDPTHQILDYVMTCTTQETIEPKTEVENTHVM